MKPPVEILAPAGSIESMKAAINAGADAVYMGGSRFGARAYADNPEEDRFLEAIDYAHLHGRRLYMTVNTLVKEAELEELVRYLTPYYERGLDAVIVQDMGVFACIRRHFPDLPIHASTQMTVTGYRSAQVLKKLGATRVVTARELSLEEIGRIRDEVDIEIESFVHGALCYCYSGQCLLSSLIGGRSGNRGRCAQPCRLPYEGQYVLSLKDLCTLDILPDIIEAGVYSLKIEGRMKSPRYTAGVVSVYRRYVDRYLQNGRKGYRVDPADRKMLLELFDRGGFTEGYYRQHNGREMVALREKPSFREGNQALFDRLDADYVEKRRQEPVYGRVTVREGEPVTLTLRTALEAEEGANAEAAKGGVDGPYCITVTGEAVQTAQNQPLTEEKLLKQMNKTGNSPFYFKTLETELAGACFVPVQTLNELRRQGMEALEAEILAGYRRMRQPSETDGGCMPGPEGRMEEPANPGGVATATAAPVKQTARVSAAPVKQAAQKPRLNVSLEDPAGFETALTHPDVNSIYLDVVGFDAETWKDLVERCHGAGKTCALILPHIFRREAQDYLSANRELLCGAGFDELVLRSMEEPVFLREIGMGEVPLVFDANLYAMNHLAVEQMRELGAGRLTLPLELNSRELERLIQNTAAGSAAADYMDASHSKALHGMAVEWEMVAYGYLPAMVSAQCIVRTKKGCTRQPELLKVKDRTGKELPVKNHCRFCYNTIYNPSPLSLLGQGRILKRLGPAVLRLSFTMETPKQMRAVLDAYADEFLRQREAKEPCADFTRGHLKRGVE